MAKHVLKGLTVPVTVTVDDPTDRRLVLDATRSVDQSFVIDHMMKLSPGINRTIAEATVKQFCEAIIDLVCNGYTVNTDICRFAPSFRGIIKSNAWDSTRNSIQVTITQGKRLREEINDTTVQIIGEKSPTMVINATEDGATHAEDNSATSGAPLHVYGRGLKVIEGNITLTDKTGKVTTIPESQWANNTPKKLTFYIPQDLPDGEYTMTVTTKAGSDHGKLLKEPHIVTQVITIGKSTNPGGGEENTPGDGGESYG
jgi:hypothetical protein